MALEEKYSKKYDKPSVELVDEVEEDGVQKEIYNILVTKNSGELQDYVKVEVPASIEDAIEMEEDGEILDIIQRGLVTRARNRKRASMVSEEDRKEKIKKTANRVEKLVAQLEEQGLSREEIEEQLGL
ncbi:MAG: hypothetical protein ACOC5T_05180 [Elusimicrobiota bacterium]